MRRSSRRRFWDMLQGAVGAKDPGVGAEVATEEIVGSIVTTNGVGRFEEDERVGKSVAAIAIGEKVTGDADGVPVGKLVAGMGTWVGELVEGVTGEGVGAATGFGVAGITGASVGAEVGFSVVGRLVGFRVGFGVRGALVGRGSGLSVGGKLSLSSISRLNTASASASRELCSARGIRKVRVNRSASVSPGFSRCSFLVARFLLRLVLSRRASPPLTRRRAAMRTSCRLINMAPRLFRCYFQKM